MTTPTPEVIVTHLKELLGNPEAVSLVDWLAMTLWAQTCEAVWVEALTSLDAGEAGNLLDLLRRDDAGPFANSLVLLTARHANAFSDSDVREWLLSDAVAATDRRIEMIAEHRDNLAAQVEWMSKRQHEEADLQTEIARLERRRDELWEGESGKRYKPVHKIEQEITRLETFDRSLRVYDEEARQRLLSDLDAKTTALKQRREELERSIADAIATRDGQQRTLEAREGALGATQVEVEQLRSRSGDLDREIERLRTEEVAYRKAEVERLWHQKQNLQSDVARLEAMRAELEGYDEPARLQELSRLREDTMLLQQRRDDVERKVAVATNSRDRAQRSHDAAASRLESLQTKLATTLSLQTQAHDAEAKCQKLWQELVTLVNSQLEAPEDHAAQSTPTPPDMPSTGFSPPPTQATSSMSTTPASSSASRDDQTPVAGEDPQAEHLAELSAHTQTLTREVEALQTSMADRAESAERASSRDATIGQQILERWVRWKVNSPWRRPDSIASGEEG